MATGPISGDAHDDIDSFPTITLNSNPDGTFRDLDSSGTAKISKARGDTSLAKDAGAAKSKGGT